MPNRIVREGILTSASVCKLAWAEEVFYRRLMSVVDDFGRYYADHGMLRAACFPRQLSKVSDSDIGKWLDAVSVAGLVRVYPALDGERYLELVKFGQQVRAKKSKFPDMPSTCVADAAQTPANDHLDVSVSVSVLSSEPVGSATTRFDEFWKAYPSKVGKDAARKAFDKRNVSQDLLAKMLAAIEVQKLSKRWNDDEGQYIPNPSTWLNQARWEDEGLAMSGSDGGGVGVHFT